MVCSRPVVGGLAWVLLLVSPQAGASLLASTHSRATRPLIYLRGGEVVAADLKRNAGAGARYRAYDINKDGVLDEKELSLAVATAVQRVDQMQSPDPIIIQFTHKAAWLWQRWRGTAFELVWRPMLFSTGVAGLIELLVRDGAHTFSAPDPTVAMVQRLLTINTAWQVLLSLTTFVLTFFLGQTYNFWRSMFSEGRSIQGRLHDTNLLLAAHAVRDERGEYKPEARELLTDVGRNLHLVHTMFWASRDVSLSVLHTPEGLKQMVAQGLMTQDERNRLESCGPAPGRWKVVCAWIMTRVAVARQQGLLIGGPGFEQTILANLCTMRGKMGTIADGPNDRMPLAYVHIVQVLVDFLLVLAPAALYPKMGLLAVPLSGVIVFFYRGLLELSKSFLDPWGNDGSEAQNVNIDVLLAEVHKDTPLWANAGQCAPISWKAA